MFRKKFIHVLMAILFLTSAVIFAEDKVAPAKEEKKEGEKVHCSEMTKSGEKCKRMTKDASGKCWQHGGKKDAAAEEEAKEEAKAIEVKKEEHKKEEAKVIELKKEIKKEEAKATEVKKEEPKKEEAKAPEVKKDKDSELPPQITTEEKEEVEAGSTQCTENTKSGERCKKKTKFANGKCKQHGGK